MLTIEHLNCGYGKHEILHDISVTIPDNKITAIVGQSGCGKTTFLKTLNRMVEEEQGYTTGKISLGDADIKSISKETLRSRIGMVFQQPIAFPHSIEKNLTYVLKYYGIRDKKVLSEKVEESLKKAKLYEEVKDQLKKSALKLSGGQKQRLAIARSLCVNPEILLLDEPCSALDMKNTIAIEETLMELKGQYTFVIVTHNLGQAKRIADQIIFMDQGKILMQGTPKEVFSRVEELKEHRLDVPQVTMLAHELRKSGLNIPEGILTSEELIGELVKLKTTIAAEGGVICP